MKEYANFSGRARRKEYWMFTLFYVIILIIAAVLDNVIGTAFNFGGTNMGYGWLYILIALAHFIPALAVSVRRLHDLGKSGWNYLIGLIPLVGGIILLVWFCTNGQSGENKWGANPKEPLHPDTHL